MKALIISYYKRPKYNVIGMFFITLVLWWAIPKWFSHYPEIGFVDISIWHLITLGVLVWLFTQVASYYIFSKMMVWLGLPSVKTLILEFKLLTTWQKFILYAVLFALWWLSAILSLLVIL